MRRVFVDTVALIALGNQRDDLHKQTREIQKQFAITPVQFITTNLIIAEFCNAFSCYISAEQG
jgi:predicted nucleic acid-binding protein